MARSVTTKYTTKDFNNKLEVIFDYRKERPGRRTRSQSYKNMTAAATPEVVNDTNSEELGMWLKDDNNKKRIWNMRCFYVIKPNAETVVKFGIAGTKGDHGAWGRLSQYIHEYGYASDLNMCTGVRLLFLAGNKYNKINPTPLENSAVFRKELACKKYFRMPEVKAHLIGRGYERIDLTRIRELFDIVDDPSNQGFEDLETERRTNERLGQQSLLPSDYVVKITTHEHKPHPSKAKTKYKCLWNRPFILTKQKVVKKKGSSFDTEETERIEEYESMPEPASKIQFYRNGDKALEVYHALHNVKWRD